MDHGRLVATVLEELRGVAGEALPTVTAELSIGSSGLAADLAVLADEFIGVIVRRPEDGVRTLREEVETAARYFDRLILVLSPWQPVNLGASPAAVWSADAGGRLVEHGAGVANEVGMSALLNLLTADERRALLEPLLPYAGAYARGPSPVPVRRVREIFESGFRERFGATSDAFWAAVDGRAIEPHDVAAMLAPPWEAAAA